MDNLVLIPEPVNMDNNRNWLVTGIRVRCFRDSGGGTGAYWNN